MEKKTKIFIGIGLGLVAAAGVFIAITKPFKKKEVEAPAEEKAEDTGSGSGGASKASATPKKSGIVIKKAAQKLSGGFNTGTTKTPASTGKPAALGKPISIAGAPEVGKPVYAYTDTNTYKAGKADRSNLIKFNKKGTQLGTYLGSAPNGFSRLIVEKGFDNSYFESLRKLYGVSKDAYVIYVLSKDVYANK